MSIIHTGKYRTYAVNYLSIFFTVIINFSTIKYLSPVDYKLFFTITSINSFYEMFISTWRSDSITRSRLSYKEITANFASIEFAKESYALIIFTIALLPFSFYFEKLILFTILYTILKFGASTVKSLLINYYSLEDTVAFELKNLVFAVIAFYTGYIFKNSTIIILSLAIGQAISMISQRHFSFKQIYFQKPIKFRILNMMNLSKVFFRYSWYYFDQLLASATLNEIAFREFKFFRTILSIPQKILTPHFRQKHNKIIILIESGRYYSLFTIAKPAIILITINLIFIKIAGNSLYKYLVDHTSSSIPLTLLILSSLTIVFSYYFEQFIALINPKK